MQIGWSKLTFTPDSDALDALRSNWSSVIGEQFTPLLFSVFGDVFYQSESGVYWLNTSADELTRIADSKEHFQSLLGTDIVNKWFLPPLVEQLYAAGKIPPPGYCYTPVVLPVFAEGKFTVSNLNPVPAKEHFGLTAEIHSQIRSLPDGTKIELSIGE
jgi:hypothetical protein